MRKLKSLDLMQLDGLIFLALFVLVLGLTGCDTPAVFQQKHPQEAVVIEDVVEFAEKMMETGADQVLHLPDGSLQLVFDHKVFVVPKATVDAAKAAGVTVPAATVPAK